MTYDLPNPFLFLSPLSAGNAAPGFVASQHAERLPSSDAVGAGAAPLGYPCCVDCGAREPCDEHCPWSGKPVPTSPEPTARFQLDEAAMLSEIEPVPAFLTDNRAEQIEEMLQLARAEDWPAPPRRMAG